MTEGQPGIKSRQNINIKERSDKGLFNSIRYFMRKNPITTAIISIILSGVGVTQYHKSSDEYILGNHIIINKESQLKSLEELYIINKNGFKEIQKIEKDSSLSEEQKDKEYIDILLKIIRTEKDVWKKTPDYNPTPDNDIIVYNKIIQSKIDISKKLKKIREELSDDVKKRLKRLLRIDSQKRKKDNYI